MYLYYALLNKRQKYILSEPYNKIKGQRHNLDTYLLGFVESVHLVEEENGPPRYNQ